MTPISLPINLSALQSSGNSHEILKANYTSTIQAKPLNRDSSKATKVLAIALLVISIAVILASITLGLGLVLAGSSFVLFSAVTAPLIAALGTKWAIVAAAVSCAVAVAQLIGSAQLLQHANRKSIELTVTHTESSPTHPSIVSKPLMIPAPPPAAIAQTVAPQQSNNPVIAPAQPTPPVPIVRQPIPKPLPIDELKVSYSRDTIATIPDTLYKMTDLIYLSLSNQRGLTNFPAALCNLTKLRTLNINETNISVLPNEIDYLSELRTFNAQKTPLKALPPEIGNLTNLEDFDMSQSSLEHLPNISKLTKLIRLRMGDTRLTHLPDCFATLQDLEEVNLERSPIETLPDSLGKVKNLRYLNLAGCSSLTSLPATLWDLPKLQISISKAQEHLLPPPTGWKKVQVYINQK